MAELKLETPMRLTWGQGVGSVEAVGVVKGMALEDGERKGSRLHLVLELQPPPGKEEPIEETTPVLAADDPANPFAGRSFKRGPDGQLREVEP